MTFKDGLSPAFYLLLSIIGIALSSVILTTYASENISTATRNSEFVFASLILAASILGAVLGSIFLVVGCMKAEVSEPMIKTSSTFSHFLVDLLTLLTGALILALSSIIISNGDAVASSATNLASVILAVSVLSVVYAGVRLSLKLAETCKERVVE